MPRLQVFIEELVQLFLFIPVQWVDLAIEGGFGIGDKLYGVVPGLSFREFVKVFF